ncbi:MAG: hypothetical protein U1F10_08005 [Burkholderiales bacterium]
MPIVDVEVVRTAGGHSGMPAASALASALGRAFGSPPGRTWVRLRWLDASCYAENDEPTAGAALPVFVTILHAHPPHGAALASEAKSVGETVAVLFGMSAERVHVQYAPAAAGRQAFGGRLVE